MKKMLKSSSTRAWDAIIVGGGHNGLVAAAYLSKANKRVCVLERREIVGGAAVTEEIIPGFKFSRASYVFSLFRPKIVQDLELARHGLTVFPRDPSSFTPSLSGKSLLLGSCKKTNFEEISKFSEKDAAAYQEYNTMLQSIVDFFVPLLDECPPDPKVLFGTNYAFRQRIEAAIALTRLGVRCAKLGRELTTLIEFMSAPASKILNRYFESEMLKATLATDAIIGAKISPSTPGSAYVLLHHVMGEVDGVKGMWGHVKGGMGSVSKAIASSAVEAGATILTDSQVTSIDVNEGNVCGVTLADGTSLKSNVVLSNASPALTFNNLIDKKHIPIDMLKHFKQSWNCESASTKINIALDRIPNFSCKPNLNNKAMPHHRGTIHFEDTMKMIEDAYLDVTMGYSSRRPVIEKNIPTSLDDSIAPEGKHIALLFVQYTPYEPKGGSWMDPARREEFAESVFNVIESYAPGFKDSIIDYDMLTPPDLEKVFSLPKGNIFHGAMGLDQLFWLRPHGGSSNYRASKIRGLYLCGAGSHPGGGVMGAPGRNAANASIKDSLF